METFFQQLINGISQGAIYALIAVGYTMVYGVLRLINFAHGDIYMVGAMMGIYVAGGRFNLLAVPWWANPLVWLVAWLAIFVILRLARVRLPAWLGTLGGLLIVVSAALIATDVATRIVKLVHIPSWLGFAIVLVAVMAFCGGLGFLIELLAYRPLRNQPRITSLITAVGVSMLLEFGGQNPRVFGANPQSFPNLVPGLEESPVAFYIGNVSVGRADVIIIGLTLFLMLALRHIVLHTRTGMALRAVSFRFDTSALMGINVNRIISVTFVLGSMLAAAAGILVAVRSNKAEPLMGLLPGLKAFIAAVLGGIGNIPGAVAGGLLLGVTEVMVAGYFPRGSQYRDGVAFVILIAVLLVKPSGLFGQNAVEKV